MVLGHLQNITKITDTLIIQWRCHPRYLAFNLMYNIVVFSVFQAKSLTTLLDVDYLSQLHFHLYIWSQSNCGSNFQYTTTTCKKNKHVSVVWWAKDYLLSKEEFLALATFLIRKAAASLWKNLLILQEGKNKSFFHIF